MTSIASRTSAIISLGSNANGAWGSSDETLTHALEELQRHVGPLLMKSRRYRTAPIGRVRQSAFLNMIVVIRSSHSPVCLLRKFKELERLAGRRSGVVQRWGARPLDIDLIDHGGLVLNWRRPKSGKTPGRAPAHLILPHPHAHLRAFVLAPLIDVIPFWNHPALKQPGRRLLAALPSAHVTAVLGSVLDRKRASCDK